MFTLNASSHEWREKAGSCHPATVIDGQYPTQSCLLAHSKPVIDSTLPFASCASAKRTLVVNHIQPLPAISGPFLISIAAVSQTTGFRQAILSLSCFDSAITCHSR